MWLRRVLEDGVLVAGFRGCTKDVGQPCPNPGEEGMGSATVTDPAEARGPSVVAGLCGQPLSLASKVKP